MAKYRDQDAICTMLQSTRMQRQLQYSMRQYKTAFLQKDIPSKSPQEQYGGQTVTDTDFKSSSACIDTFRLALYATTP